MAAVNRTLYCLDIKKITTNLKISQLNVVILKTTVNFLKTGIFFNFFLWLKKFHALKYDDEPTRYNDF